ncbi:MAG: hypothetical protein MI743_21630 [Sneathiellales bacterium]|nr:hypothetical protein [Sneathiellales bacterium]
MTVTFAASDPYAYLDRPYEGAIVEPRYQSSSEKIEEGAKEGEKKDMALFGEDGFGFDDFLDIINPLQHIPVISNIYRKFTGDELSPGARMIGGGIFGGGIGLASSVINSAIEAETGKDIGGHVIGFITGEDGAQESGATVAKSEETGQEIATQEVTRESETPSAVTTRQTEAAAVTPAALPVAAQPTASDQAGSNLPLGLKWKGAGPDISQKLDQVQALNGRNLSESQMQHILNAFGNQNATPKAAGTAAPLSANPKQAPVADTIGAAKAYEKNAVENSAIPKTVSQSSFDYLDRTI